MEETAYLGQKKRHVPVQIEMMDDFPGFKGELLGTDNNGVMVKEDGAMFFVPFSAMYCMKYLKEEKKEG